MLNPAGPHHETAVIGTTRREGGSTEAPSSHSFPALQGWPRIYLDQARMRTCLWTSILPAFYGRFPPAQESFDWSEWHGTVGTLLGVLLGFGSGFLQSRFAEKRKARQEAVAAAFSCHERLDSFPKGPGPTVQPYELELLKSDLEVYKSKMLSTTNTR